MSRTNTPSLLRAVDVPCGQSGDWRVERFTVSKREADFENLRASIGTSSRGIVAGSYTRLMHRQHIVMSDTPIEFSDHARAVLMSKGHVLIGGLGLGMVVQAVLDKPEVKHVQVIENSTDVINLIGPHYEQRYGHRLDIIEADLIKWLPKKAARYDMAWFDIWDGICSDNANEMKKLKRRFQQRCDWVGCWCYNETLRAR